MTRFIQYGWLLAGVVGCPHLLQAQTRISWGPSLGVNVTTVLERNVLYYETEPDLEYVVGPRLGVMADIGFGKFSFQPHLVYTRKGYQYEIAQSRISAHEQYKLRLHYLELPLNVVYTTGTEKGFQVVGGPYVSVGVSGKQWFKTERIVNGVVVSEREQNLRVRYGTDFRRFEAGFNVGVGYRVAQLQGQVSYGLGVTNTIPGNGSGSRRNQALQLSVAYLLQAK